MRRCRAILILFARAIRYVGRGALPPRSRAQGICAHTRRRSMSDNHSRLLGYTMARELTQDEIARVSGGTGNPTPSWSGPESAQQHDDVSTDPF
jgi:hypothetical protein